MGGNQATSLWGMVLKEPCFDFGGRGEGEKKFFVLWKGFFPGKLLSKIYAKLPIKEVQGNIMKTPDRELILFLKSNILSSTGDVDRG